jgi:DNA invertase Pin-like site-specific DNA recombinase
MTACGAAIEAEARRLRQAGVSRHAIARALGISVRAVERATGEAEARRPSGIRAWRAT